MATQHKSCSEQLEELKGLGFDESVVEDHDGGSVVVVGCSCCSAYYGEDDNVPYHELYCQNKKSMTGRISRPSMQNITLRTRLGKQIHDALVKDVPPIDVDYASVEERLIKQLGGVDGKDKGGEFE